MSERTRIWLTIGVFAIIGIAFLFIAQPWKQQPPTQVTEQSQEPSTPTEPTQPPTQPPTPPPTIEPTPVEPQPSQPVPAATRTGEVPPEPKIVGPAEGLTEIGLAGGRVVVGTTTGPKTLNPVVAQETSTTNITGLLHGTLIEINPITAKEEPGLVTRWEISEDKKEVTFYLRRGVKWSDGHCCLTADDVVFTFNDVILNLDVNTDDRDGFKIKDQYITVVRVDDLAFKVITLEPFRPIIRSMANYVMPRHKLADKIAKLNAGALGYLDGLKKVLESVHEQIKEKTAEPLDAFDKTIADIESAVTQQNIDKVRETYALAQVALDILQEALESQEGLDDAITAATSTVEEDLKKTLEFAEAGRWEGVSPELFNNTWGLGSPAEEITGLGPYRFVRYDTDQQVVLERNPYYWKVDTNGVQLPYLDEFVFLVVQNQDTALLKFQTGETDTLAPRPTDWPLLMDSVKDLERDCTTKENATIICIDSINNRKLLRDGPTFGTEFITLNQDAEDPVLREILRDVRFRQALAYAVDKQTLIDNVYNGLALPQWSPVSVPSPFFDKSESFIKYEFDMEKANQLLDEMGLEEKNTEGIRLRPDGKPLEILLYTNQGATQREKTASILIEDFKKVGVKMNLRPVDFNALVTSLTGAKYEAVIIGFTGGIEPHFSANVWRTEGGLHFWRYSAKENPPDWEKRVDELFDLGATTFDEEEVQKIYNELQKLATENVPLIYTVNQQYIYVMKAGLGNGDNFNPVGSVLAFSDMVWWKDESRRQAP